MSTFAGRLLYSQIARTSTREPVTVSYSYINHEGIETGSVTVAIRDDGSTATLTTGGLEQKTPIRAGEFVDLPGGPTITARLTLTWQGLWLRDP